MRYCWLHTLTDLWDRTLIGLILVAVGAPLAAICISAGAPETAVYFLAFGLAGVIAFAWLSRSQGKSALSADSTSTLHSVLLVEQEESLRRYITELFRARNILVHSAASPDEALSLVHRRANTFDLVLLDVNLPPLSGVDLSAILRRERPYQALVVLAAYKEAWGARRAPVLRIVDASAPTPVRAELEELLGTPA
jgi:CheY-like chemotaxis protein